MIFLEITLGLISIGLLIFGVAYAWLIYHRPFPPGKTWLSVVIGVGATIMCEMAATVITLSYYGLQHLFWIALFPVVTFALTGFPMIIFQERKRQKQLKRNRQLRREFDDV